MSTFKESPRASDAYRKGGYKPFNHEKGGPKKLSKHPNLRVNNQKDNTMDGEKDAEKVGKTNDVTNRDTTCKGDYPKY